MALRDYVQIVEDYVEQYVRAVIEEPCQQERFIGIAQRILKVEMQQDAPPSLVRVHRLLEKILDNNQAFAPRGAYSLRDNDSNTTLDDLDPYMEDSEDDDENPRLILDLQGTLDERTIRYLVATFGSEENLMQRLSHSRLSAENIPQLHVPETLTRLLQLPERSRKQYIDYLFFRKMGKRINPLRKLTAESSPIISATLDGLVHSKHPKKDLVDLGFSGIIHEGRGLTNLVYQVNPRMLNHVRYIPRWINKDNRIAEESFAYAMQDALWAITGYKEAELGGNRVQQVRIINKFLTQNPAALTYFISMSPSLGSLRHQGKACPSTIEKRTQRNSLRVMLEWYSQTKHLDWFDRNLDEYVQAWRILENGMWKRGDTSVALALDAIADMLYTIQGYREAERMEDRDKQVEIISQFITTEKCLTKYAREAGLDGLFSNCYDPSGEYGFRKQCSVKAMLEFYSEKKRLGWFDRSQEHYVQRWRITEQGMWKDKEKTVPLAIEAIEDVLYSIPRYREAEQTQDIFTQLKILDEEVF
ncbi:hypothetical protein HZB02_03555 [Candidatus Woesearchaeota archaeon]|nr:hypothetical protein [Candidatus Woesearchaeota archaeon]